MHTFQITIQRKVSEGWPVVVEQAAPGQFLPMRTEGLLQLDVDALRIQPASLAYGTALGKAIFSEPLYSAFLRALAASGNALRVLLCVEADDLKSLHWQMLCGPLDGQWTFLALNQRTLFSLYLPAVTDRRFPSLVRRDLRGLALVASPPGLPDYGLVPFDVATTVATLRAAFGAIPCDILADAPGAVGRPTLDALCARIVAERYSLIHIVCHGAYSSQQHEASLFLSGADGGLDRVASSRLIARLSQLDAAGGLPHLAFLAACETASPAADMALGSLAQRLVRDLGMPAVIAMTDRVTYATAQDLASGFYRNLLAHGEVDRALTEAAAALAERGDILVPALFSRLGDRPIFSQAADRPLTASEIAAGVDHLMSLLAQRAPVLLPAARDAAEVVRTAPDTSVVRVSATANAERAQAIARLNNLCLDALDMDFHSLARGEPAPPYDGRCPFRGLASFRPEDQAFFFGRTPLATHLTERLRAERFLALIGGSGCGKSSLALAGIGPALQQRAPGVSLLIMTPGREPLRTLDTLIGASTTDGVLLIVDQLEELFTLTQNDAQRRAFLARLATLARQAQQGTGAFYILLTLRAEFLGEAARSPEIRELLQRHQELIAPMNPSELRRAMEDQASTVGLRFEADLANTMLDEVVGEPGAMPLLQHALLELWKRRHGRWLRAEEYRALGGVKRAIAATANDLYAQLSADDQARMQRLLLRLVNIDAGADQRDTRRRASLDDLVRNDADRTATVALIQRLADARLVVTSVNAVDGHSEIELAHETMIAHWERLQGWIEQDRLGLVTRQRLSEDARAWQQNGRRGDYLHRPAQIEPMLRWIDTHPDDLTPLEVDFVAASQRQNRISKVRRSAVVASLVALPLVAVVAVMLFFHIGFFAPARIAWTVPSDDRKKMITDIAAGHNGRVISGRMDTAEIWLSDDGGETWTPHTLAGKAIEDLAVDPQDRAILYAVVTDEGLYRSEDNGRSWQRTPQDLRDIRPTFATIGLDGTLYLSGKTVPLLRSTDRGTTWTPLDQTPVITVTQLASSEAGPLVGTTAGLWRWSPVLGWQQLLPAHTGWVFGLAAHEDIIYGATRSGLWRIQDGWTEKMTDIVITHIDSFPGIPPIFIAGTNKGSLVWWKADAKIVEEFLIDNQGAAVNHVSSLLVDPWRPDHLYVGTLTGIYLGDARSWIREKR